MWASFLSTFPRPLCLQSEINTTTNYQLITTSNWVLNYGASYHVTNDLVNLPLYYLYSGLDNVVLGDGTCLSIQNSSTMQLSSSTHTLMLDNVLRVPTMFMNLILVLDLYASNTVTVLIFFNHYFSGIGSSNRGNYGHGKVH